MELEYKMQSREERGDWESPEGGAADVILDSIGTIDDYVEECDGHYLTGSDAERVMERKNYQADVKEFEALGMPKNKARIYVNELYGKNQ